MLERLLTVQAISMFLGLLIVEILLAGDPTGCVKTLNTIAKPYRMQYSIYLMT